jgi:hypothetical protein
MGVTMALRDDKFIHTSHLVVELVQAQTANMQDADAVATSLSPLLYDLVYYTLQHTLVLPCGAIKLVLGNIPDIDGEWPV